MEPNTERDALIQKADQYLTDWFMKEKNRLKFNSEESFDDDIGYIVSLCSYFIREIFGGKRAC